MQCGKVARLPATGLSRIAAAASLRRAEVNGYPALILRFDGAIDTLVQPQGGIGPPMPVLTGPSILGRPAGDGHAAH